MKLWIKVRLHHVISYMAHEGRVTRACREQICSLFKQTLPYCLMMVVTNDTLSSFYKGLVYKELSQKYPRFCDDLSVKS